MIWLARTLPPSDFGLMTMAIVITGFAALFKDLGVGSAVIQAGDRSTSWLSTLFWVAAGVGLAVTAILAVAAPLVAQIYREPALTDLVRVLSLTFVITGVSVVHQAILERDLRYFDLARVEGVGAIVGAIAAIAAAEAGAGVWSLVAQTLVAAAAGTLLLWVTARWRPALTFSRREARIGGGYGAGLTTFNVVNYAARNGDYFLIGRQLGPQQLGYYTLAYRLMLLPLQMVTAVVNRVMFPSLSRVRDDPERFRWLYRRSVGATAFAAFPIGFGLLVTAPRLIPTVLGQEWEPAVPAAMILSLVGVLQAVSASVGPLLLATGAIGTLVRWGVASSITVLCAFLIGLNWGIEGVAAAYLVVSVLLVYPAFAIALHPIGLGLTDVVVETWRPLVAAAAMAALVAAISLTVGPGGNQLAILLVEIGVGIAAYSGLSLVLNRSQTRLVLARLTGA
jgi:PST family polysaccharide transporter